MAAPAPNPTDRQGSEEAPRLLAEAREGLPTGESHQQTDEERRAQGRRNIAIALCVVGFAVLIYLTTFLRLAENIKASAGAG